MGRSVLVVDDDAGFRALATRILESWGHDVVGQAGSVAQALASAQVLRPDTVLADIGLPDGDGFALARQLTGGSPALRVVLTSSDADAGNWPAAARVGACGFIPKDELPSRRGRQLIGGS